MAPPRVIVVTEAKDLPMEPIDGHPTFSIRLLEYRRVVTSYSVGYGLL